MNDEHRRIFAGIYIQPAQPMRVLPTMQPFHELDVVEVLINIDEVGISAGDIGTITLVYSEKSMPHYEVEVVTNTGHCIAAPRAISHVNLRKI